MFARSGGWCVAAPDPAIRRHDQGDDTASEPTGNGCRDAELENGKPSSCCTDVEADDQPDDPPDHTSRARSDGYASSTQRHAA